MYIILIKDSTNMNHLSNFLYSPISGLIMTNNTYRCEYMQLTVSTDSALRTLIYLGKKNAPGTIAEVAEACRISKSSLMKVVMTLVNAKLVVSERGRKLSSSSSSSSAMSPSARLIAADVLPPWLECASFMTIANVLPPSVAISSRMNGNFCTVRA